MNKMRKGPLKKEEEERGRGSGKGGAFIAFLNPFSKAYIHSSSNLQD